MSLEEELKDEVAAIFRKSWTERDGNVVPTYESINLDNDAVNIEATVLYADMADSTKLVDNKTKTFAAEIYKTYLRCAAKIIRSEDGVITAYDGDRIMAVYLGNTKNTSAVRTALKVNYAVRFIIAPALKAQYQQTTYTPVQVIGIDTSKLFVAKTGVRGANDLVWVGRAANYAAKLTMLPHSYSTYITASVYEIMNKQVKTTDGTAMWEAVTWNTFNNDTIYRSNWWYRVT
jgi:uridylate cyclase